MPKIDYEKAARREAARPAPPGRSVNRKAKTSNGQRAKIAAMCIELGDREPTFPKMAYDANLEIDRLQRVLDTRKRMAGS